MDLTDTQRTAIEKMHRTRQRVFRVTLPATAVMVALFVAQFFVQSPVLDHGLDDALTVILLLTLFVESWVFGKRLDKLSKAFPEPASPEKAPERV